MRLGGQSRIFEAQSLNDLDRIIRLADQYGLSAIVAPHNFHEWNDEDCIAFGEQARNAGLVVGEAGYWGNMLHPDEAIRNEHISTVRRMLYKADLMQVSCLVTLVGSRDGVRGPLSPHPYNFTKEAKNEFCDIVLRLMEGLDLKHVKYATEPWPNTFYYQPETILEFLQMIDHPRVGVHFDQMNMVSQFNYYQTTELINRSFDLLGEYIISVHAKDILWDPEHMFLKFDEVYPGDGVLDFSTFLRRVSELDPNMCVFTEHFQTEEQFAVAFSRLHFLAEQNGLQFVKRTS